MNKKTTIAYFFIFHIAITSSFSQTTDGIIDIFLNYKNEGIKLKQSFYEDNQLEEYQFEVDSNLVVLATGNNLFFQLENKRTKKTKSENTVEFFNYIEQELYKSEYIKIYENDENRIITYRQKNGSQASYLEIYYEDNKLSLIELTKMKEYGTDEFKNIETIYNINSSKIDFLGLELDKKEFERSITKCKKSKLPEEKLIVTDNDSLIATYNIEFDTGKSIFRDISFQDIHSIANTIKLNPKKKFIIAGNTSSPGARSANYILSRKRAEFISKVLIKYFEINKDQLEYKGNGEDYPIYDNHTEKNRKLNRRIDLIYSKQI